MGHSAEVKTGKAVVKVIYRIQILKENVVYLVI